MISYLGSLVQFSPAAGRAGRCRQISLCVRSTPRVPATRGLPHYRGVCAFRVYTAQAPGCSIWSGPCCWVRFQFSGPPQKHGFGCACVLCLPRPQRFRQPEVWDGLDPCLLYKSWTSIHSSSGTLSDLIPWIYLSLSLYIHKSLDLGHTSSGFPYFLQFKKKMVVWRREWQITSVFLPWEPHEQYEKAKR